MEGHTLASFRPEGSKAVVSFDRVKAFYILGLVGFHQSLLNAPNHRVQVSHYLPYPTIDHGVELMMGMMLISGWLSSATWKDATWADHMRKKVARLIPPYIVAVCFTALPLVLAYQSWHNLLQYVLEILTVGGWNPFLTFWTANRPLWFLSTLLTYHYVSPFFLRWTRRQSVRHLLVVLAFLYLLRTVVACVVLLVLEQWTGDLQTYGRIIHLWSPTQIWVPFMGAILQQLTVRTTLPAWVRKWHIWVLTDFLILVFVGCTHFLPKTGLPYVDALIAFNNLATGPLQLILVALVSCDCNSFRVLSSLTKGSCQLAASLLKLSYTIYLTHWPWAVCMHYAGLFSLDSWNSMLATWATSILFAIVLDFVVVDPFTAMFYGWIMPQKPKPSTPAEDPTKNTAQTADAQSKEDKDEQDEKKAVQIPDLEAGLVLLAPSVRSCRRAGSLPYTAFRYSQV
ncbi:PFP-BETA1 [Symbiodinium pilosum]|uniref:PFP-BETA1 protein n=1 Tax=Symbiodinium pilosum TaxID=2952 RepID=A0A812TDE7_SYMPI|nr:PFP-BETA1 [Symbiodinium pilosum]